MQKRALQAQAGGMAPPNYHHPRHMTQMPFKDKNILHIWQGFKENTSSHGIQQMDRAAGFLKKSFWSGTVLLCFGFLIFHLTSVTMQYLSYKVNVVVELRQSRELTFPAVTVCNMNPFVISKLSNNSELESLLAKSTESKRKKRAAADLAEQKEDFVTQEKVLEVLTTIPENVKKEMGHQQNELIVDCDFAGYPCNKSAIVHFYDPVHGNCFIYNSGWLPDEPLKVSHRTGRRYGLKMVINSEQHKYVENLGESAGARLIVLPQHDMPFPQDQGVMAKPGELASIGLRQIVVHRLQHPYGNCTDADQIDTMRNVYEQFYPVRYTTAACVKTCYQRHLIESCKCADPQIPLGGEAFGNMTFPSCLTGTPEDDCRKEVEAKYEKGETTCECPNPCSEKNYALEVSNNIWPSQVHEKKLRKLVESNELEHGHETLHIYNTSEEIRRNFLKVEVYFEDFNHEMISEKPAYPDENFMSDLGGILGLWLGCSVVSIFEWLELFFDLMVVSIYRLTCARMKSKRQMRKTPFQTNWGQPVGWDDAQATNKPPNREVKQKLRSPPPPYDQKDGQDRAIAPTYPTTKLATTNLDFYRRNMNYMRK